MRTAASRCDASAPRRRLAGKIQDWIYALRLSGLPPLAARNLPSFVTHCYLSTSSFTTNAESQSTLAASRITTPSSVSPRKNRAWTSRKTGGGGVILDTGTERMPMTTSATMPNSREHRAR